MIVTVCGHADAQLNEKEKILLETEFRKLIKASENCEFYLGGYGDFDGVCYNVLKKIKQDKGAIKIIFITPYINETYAKLKIYKNMYDEIIYPEIENCPKKFAIERRNFWMIKKADFLICYIKRNYDGAYKTYKYAKTHGIPFLNIATDK